MNNDSCCIIYQCLEKLINSGEACINYNKNNYGAKQWSSKEWLNTTRNSNGALILPFIYLKEPCNGQPQESHCLGYDNNGGTPNIETSDQLKWWQLLFQAFVNCTFQLAQSVGRVLQGACSF